jgi:uncharacterized 2Fe-2S/4Fe-4S cluster protein (DUF4445 family)
MSLKIKTTDSDFEIDDGFGHSLLDLAQAAGVQVNARCASEGICGGCMVILEAGQFVVANQRVTASLDNPLPVLACQTELADREAKIRFPRNSTVEREARIDEDFRLKHFTLAAQTRKFAVRVPPPDTPLTHSAWESIDIEMRLQLGHQKCDVPIDCLQKIPQALTGGRQLTVTVGRIGKQWSVIDIEPGDTGESHFAVAVDLGTTTVVAILVDMNQGRVLKTASSYNQQIRRADDVASRIAYCRSAEHVHDLQRLVVHETVNTLVETLCREQQIPADRISRIAISGNTVMTHLFLGISPESIGQVPFQPVAKCYDKFRARDLQLRINPLGIVDVVPSVSGYVGGDIVSDIYAARLIERGEPTLLVDIGTNGEMVYSENGEYTVCATAAGPAFEGYGTTYGCRAAAGAIEHVSFAGDLQFETRVIGGGRATGLCGSAFIDFIACGMRCGLINRMGRFNVEQLRDAGRYLRIEEMCGVIHACVVAADPQASSEEAIYVSEADVAQVLKAKAAIYAGMKTLLGVRNKKFSDVERFCLAGGFARHINLQNAIFMGLLPEIPLDRFDLLGNGSLAGAMLALVDADAMNAYETVAKLPEVVELNRVASFENSFIDALALPNMNTAEFPNVMSEIEAFRRPE